MSCPFRHRWRNLLKATWTSSANNFCMDTMSSTPAFLEKIPKRTTWQGFREILPESIIWRNHMLMISTLRTQVVTWTKWWLIRFLRIKSVTNYPLSNCTIRLNLFFLRWGSLLGESFPHSLGPWEVAGGCKPVEWSPSDHSH